MENEQIELMGVVSSLLSQNKIPYMITGAWSVIFYGRPRASHDIDFIINVEKKDAKRAVQTLGSVGPDFLLQREAIEEALEKRTMFNILHLPTMLKFDFFLLKDEPFDSSRFKRKKKVKILNYEMWLASPEDTIIQKLRWYKEARIEKHLVDAAFVYQIQKENLDIHYLNKWITKLNLAKEYKELKKVDLENYL